MPDGRPLFAWENELEMLRASGGILKKRIKEFEDLERVFNFAVLHWKDFCNNELHFFVRAESALLKDFSINPEKYFQVAEQGST